jgi:hypothetical protein
MKRWIALLLVTFQATVLTTGFAAAQEQRAEVTLGPGGQGPFWTGEQLTLELDLSTPALSFSDIHFNLPEVPGALVLRTDTTTVKLSERRAGETWQVLRFPITLFPQRSGTLEVPAFEVRFQTLNGFGAEPVAHRLETAPLSFEIRQPPGVAPGQVVVTTSRLQLDASWDLAEDPLKPGDAVTLTVERQAMGLSAMLLPPLPVAEPEGLAAYPAEPDIDDRTNRGSLTGVRRDRVTWIVEQAGDYALPDILFRNWDPAREQLQTDRVEGVSFSAVAPPGQTDADAATRGTPASSPGKPDLLALLKVAIPIVLLALLGWRFRAAIHLAARRLRGRILPPARALLRTLNPGTSS